MYFWMWPNLLAAQVVAILIRAEAKTTIRTVEAVEAEAVSSAYRYGFYSGIRFC